MSTRTDAERERLRRTFGQAVDLYEKVRPSYPEALYEDLVAAAHLAPDDRLLEVGCATGKATRPLALGGYAITCVELSPELAAAARENLKEYDVTVVDGTLEEFVTDDPFALVFAATAWHWIDPAVGYQRAWQALKPGGYLAIWGQNHVFPDGGDPFFAEIQDVYDEIGAGLPDDAQRPRPGELADDRAVIESSGLFTVELVRQYDWELMYTAEEYIGLLSSFSDHIEMADWQRDRLFGEIRRRLAKRRGNSVRRHWGSVLHVAKRRDNALNP